MKNENGLERILAIRRASAVIGLVFTIPLWILWGTETAIPMFLCIVGMLFSTSYLDYIIRSEAYIMVSGTVTSITYRGFWRRPQIITVDTGSKLLRIHLQSRRGIPQTGEYCEIYLLRSQPIYERNGQYEIINYLALQKKIINI